MGKDFRVGLMTGVVLAGAALIWVATRPSLSLRTPVAGAKHTPSNSEAGQNASPPLPWGGAEVAEANGAQIRSRESGRPRDILQQIQDVAQSPPPSAPASPRPALAGGGTPSVAETPQASGAPSPVPPDLTIYERTEPIKTTRFHIVRKGESLSSIAGQYYGSSTQWRKIVAANQKSIKDPNKIAPGTKLIIPD